MSPHEIAQWQPFGAPTLPGWLLWVTAGYVTGRHFVVLSKDAGPRGWLLFLTSRFVMLWFWPVVWACYGCCRGAEKAGLQSPAAWHAIETLCVLALLWAVFQVASIYLAPFRLLEWIYRLQHGGQLPPGYYPGIGF